MISFIVPTYNEADVCKRLDRMVRFLKNCSYEIIVVDDSNEENYSLLDKYREQAEFKFVLIKGSKKGKGAAIKAAVGKTSGSIIFYVDSDLIIPLKYIHELTDKITKEDYDLVIAERPLIRAPRNLMRMFFSASLSVLQRVFVFQSDFFHDTQCGFKAFKADVLRKIVSKQTVDPGMFDIEYLYIAPKNRFKIAKVRTVPLPEIRQSKVNLISCLVHDPQDLLKIKINGITGKYLLEKAGAVSGAFELEPRGN